MPRKRRRFRFLSRRKNQGNPVVYLSKESKLHVQVLGASLDVPYAELGPILIQLGLAAFRTQETGNVREAIETAIGTDYLASFRANGVDGLRQKPNEYEP